MQINDISDQSSGSLTTKLESAPVCGIYAAFAAFRSLGHRVDFQLVMTSKYMSDSELGSSDEDLKKLIIDHDLQYVDHAFLSTSALKQMDTPAILHVNRRSDVGCGGHWLTFLGVDKNKFVIFDSLHTPPVRKVSPSELLTRWNGRAISIYRSSPNLASKSYYTSVSYIDQLLLVCFIGICMVVFPCKRVAFSHHLVGIFALALAGTILFQVIQQDSLWKDRTSAIWMATPERAVASRLASVEEFFQARVDGNLVDARIDSARSRTLIEGAKHLGVDFGVGDFKLVAANLNVKQPVVVFCNSRNCLWADSVANKLKAIGFDARVFRRGYEGYLEETYLDKQIFEKQILE